MKSEKKQTEVPTFLALPNNTYAYQHEDEIDLVNVWKTLVKRKKIIGQFILASLVVGSVYALIKPEKYAFTAVLQIGTLLSRDHDNQSVLIESTQDVFNKVKSAYIPFVLTKNEKEGTAKKSGSHLKFEEVIQPKDTSIIKLEMHCKPIDETTCTSVINEVVQKIIDDHSTIVNVSQKNLLGRLEAAENVLQNSKDEVEFIGAKKKRLIQTAELYTNQLKEKKALLERNLKNRSSIKTTNSAGAMSVLLIDNEIQRNQELIDDLEKRLYINLNQEQDDLDKALKANIRHQSEQQNSIEQLKNLLQSISNTKTVVPVLRSENPIGISPFFVILLSILIGLFAGLFAVILCEFADHVKNRDKENNKLEDPTFRVV